MRYKTQLFELTGHLFGFFEGPAFLVGAAAKLEWQGLPVSRRFPSGEREITQERRPT
jgi:hypothetical protein